MNEEKKEYKIPVGFVNFDDTKQGDSGWCSKSGEEPFRINGYNELDQAVTWITNVNYNEFRDLGFNNLSYLKESHYMRVTPDVLVKELNLSRIEKKVQYISKIYQRIADLGYQNFGVDAKDMSYRYSNLISQHVLPQNIKRKPKENKEAIEEAIESSTQYFQKSTGNEPRGNKMVTLTMPRIAYFNWLLSRKVPDNNDWSKLTFNSGSIEVGVEKNEVVKGTITKMKKIAEMAENSAIIFDISIKSMDKDYARFASLGAGKSQRRTWVSYPELKEMIKYSKIEIKKGIKTKLSSLDENIKDKDNQTNFSYSKGVFLDNLANAVLSQPDKYTHSGIVPYLRAYDRMACFNIAEKLHKEGYFVKSYGLGKISILVPEKSIVDVVSKSLSWGLIPSLEIFEKIDTEEIYIEEITEDFAEELFIEDLYNFIKEDFLIDTFRSLAVYDLLNADIIMEMDDIIDYKSDEQANKLQELFNKIQEIEDRKKEDDGNRSQNEDEIIDL